jgi:hypothetical protein
MTMCHFWCMLLVSKVHNFTLSSSKMKIIMSTKNLFYIPQNILSGPKKNLDLKIQKKHYKKFTKKQKTNIFIFFHKIFEFDQI